MFLYNVIHSAMLYLTIISENTHDKRVIPVTIIGFLLTRKEKDVKHFMLDSFPLCPAINKLN